MNFIKVLFKFLSFFLLGVALFPVYSFAEYTKSPFENDGLRSELAIPSSLFAESPDKFFFELNGTLIFSSSKKIGIYNGLNWDFIDLNFEPILCVSPAGSIFISSGNILYRLEIKDGHKYFLSKYVEIPTDNQELIRQIVSLDKGILINTSSSLYFVDSGNVKVIIEEGENINIFKTKTRTILRNANKYAGFSVGSGIGPWSVSETEYKFIEDHPQGYLAYSEADALFYIISPSFTNQKEWNQKCPGKVLDIIHLANENYGILTNEQEYYQINTSGEILTSTELSGINDNSKLKLSSINEVWVSNSYGFSILNFSSSFQEINIDHLKSGIISSCCLNDKLYVSDGYALYELPGNHKLKSGNIHSLTSFWQGFLYIENKVLYYYSNGISRQSWPEKILNYKIDPVENKVLIELPDRFLILKPTFSGFFEETKNFEKVLEKEYTFYNNFLLYHSENTLYRINIENLKKDSLVFPEMENGQKILQLLYSGNRYIIGTQQNVYFLSRDSTERFYPNKIDDQEAQQNIIFTNNDFIFSYWAENNSKPGFIQLIFPDGKKEKIKYFPENLSIHNNLSIRRLRKDEYFLINPDRVIHYLADESDTRNEFFVVPKRIIINEREVFNGQIFDLEKAQLNILLRQIPSKNNSFEMEFSSSDFLSGVNKFQYFLMGRDKYWSSWEAGDRISFNNLKPGAYLLKLRISNANNYISETFKLNITVLVPFYLSTYAKIIYLLLFLLVLFVIYRLYRLYSHIWSENDKEKIKIEAFNKSEPVNDLLDEEPNSAKIRENIKSKWDKYNMVTVLFSDIQGFTKIAEMMNPEKLIDELDQFFFHFDSVVDKYNIEKIKTIGDAYMAAGGIPHKNTTNPIEVVLAALEMQQYMKQLKNTKIDIWDLRIGIHTGPVIAGEIGHKKRSFDIWGDSVNIASRMESSGEPGKVNVSGTTYNLIKDFFICEYRGKIPVKYKGNLDMYFVTGLRPELSINLVGLPNKMFFLKLQLKRLHDLELYIFGRLEAELPQSLYFHNINHARQVYNHSYLLAKSESLDVEETLEVRTASLLLHLGYINNYRNPEVESGNFSLEILGSFQYSERQINIIRNLILSTKQPFEPQNIMEQIVIDAKMEYLGRADYIKNSELLFKEENEILGTKSVEQWKNKQIELLNNFEYYTAGARRLREISFKEQIERIK